MTPMIFSAHAAHLLHKLHFTSKKKRKFHAARGDERVLRDWCEKLLGLTPAPKHDNSSKESHAMNRGCRNRVFMHVWTLHSLAFHSLRFSHQQCSFEQKMHSVLSQEEQQTLLTAQGSNCTLVIVLQMSKLSMFRQCC